MQRCLRCIETVGSSDFHVESTSNHYRPVKSVDFWGFLGVRISRCLTFWPPTHWSPHQGSHIDPPLRTRSCLMARCWSCFGKASARPMTRWCTTGWVALIRMGMEQDRTWVGRQDQMEVVCRVFVDQMGYSECQAAIAQVLQVAGAVTGATGVAGSKRIERWKGMHHCINFASFTTEVPIKTPLFSDWKWPRHVAPHMF